MKYETSELLDLVTLLSSKNQNVFVEKAPGPDAILFVLLFLMQLLGLAAVLFVFLNKSRSDAPAVRVAQAAQAAPVAQAAPQAEERRA